MNAKAVALACINPEEPGEEVSSVEEIGGKDEPVILSDLKKVPDLLLGQLRVIQPHIEWRFSRTAGDSYWANICPHCGALFGDFFLHCEPGGAFFPEDDDNASRIQIHTLAVPGSIDIDASWGIGVGGLVFSKGQRV
jgi:hypothetical protein